MNRQTLRKGWPGWRDLTAALGCLGFLGFIVSAWAATPNDPTEAPPAWVSTLPPSNVSNTGEAPPEMQVILTGKSRRLAIVSGAIVKVGDDYKGSKVRAIKANQVVMDDAEKSLSMTPDVKKSAPSRVKTRKKSVVISADSVPSKAHREKP